MLEESSAYTAPRRETRRVDRPPLVVESTVYLQDVLTASILLISLAACFQAGDGYPARPFFAFVLPALFLATSGRYRRQVLGRLRRQWGRIEAYSTGDGPIPWLAATLFATAPAWVLYVSNGRMTDVVDTLPVIPTAESLLTEGNLELGEYLAKDRNPTLLGPGGQIPGCIVAAGGKYYSSYPVGMVPFAAAVTGLSQLAGADLTKHEVQLRLQKLTASLVAAMCVGIFFLIALRLGHPTAAWVATAILAAASGMFSTVAMGLWQHGGIILWSMIVMLVEFLPGTRGTRRGAIVQGVACSLMVTCRLTSASFLAPFFAWAFLRDPRRAATILVVALLAYAPWALLYGSIYASPFGPSSAFLSGGLWTPDVGTPLAGLLISPGRGLLVYQPWVLLALASFLPRVRSGWSATAGTVGPSGWEGFCVAAIVLHLFLISAWGCWWGGWCWGSRLVIETVPLFALLCVRPIAALGRSNRTRALVVGLAMLGVLAQWPWLYSDGSRWNDAAHLPGDLWSWSRAPFLNPEPRGLDRGPTP